MGLFDFFRKKKEESQPERKPRMVADSFDKPAAKKSEKHWTDDIFKMEIKDGVIERVWDANIENGTFVVPKNVSKINMFAFKDCKTLETLVLHEGITFIAPHAFAGCENLKTVVGLENLSGMKSVGGFSGCKNLERISLPETTGTIGDSAFKNCVNLKALIIPNGCWAISQHAFENCAGINYLEIPPSMTLISRWAFDGCHNLTITFAPDDMFEKHTINMEIQGKSFEMPSGDVIIEKGALNDVKTVCAHDIKILEKVVASGYRGVITFFDDEKDQVISIDLALIDQMSKGIDETHFGQEEFYQGYDEHDENELDEELGDE